MYQKNELGFLDLSSLISLGTNIGGALLSASTAKSAAKTDAATQKAIAASRLAAEQKAIEANAGLQFELSKMRNKTFLILGGMGLVGALLFFRKK
jgi:hypothetical protein